jgi:DNA-binding protein H-NS
MNDLTMLGIDDLLGMKAKIDGELKSRAAEELANMEKRREQLLLLVGTEKPPVDELAVRRTRKASVAKYRNPANPDQTWTGRGKKPNWLTDPVDDCLIPVAVAA